MSGTNITYSVYSAGYNTITGSTQLTDDITLNIALTSTDIEKFAWTNNDTTIYTSSVTPIVNDTAVDVNDEEVGTISEIVQEYGLTTGIVISDVVYSRDAENDIPTPEPTPEPTEEP